MDINLTLFGEVITFAILIFVTVKFIWPPLTRAMDARQKQIADGLAAAERSQRGLELTRKKIKSELKAAKIDAAGIIEQATAQSSKILEAAREQANNEGLKIIASAKNEIVGEMAIAKQELQKHTAELVVAATKKLLQEKMTVEMDAKLIDQVIEEL